jgi:exopolysaccharide biosynthesis protein
MTCCERAQRRRRSTALPGLILGVCGLLAGTDQPAFGVPQDSSTDGLEIIVWHPGGRCGEAVPALLIAKIDPERYRFSTYHFADEGLAAPPTIEEWQRRTGAMIVFNAGLFRDDYSYLGLLRKAGRWLAAKPHPSWRGLFVAEPEAAALRKARVLDLAMEAAPVQQFPYREAAQSIMLLDRNGQPRVRNSGKRAHQTVIGEDRDGHILIIKTVQPATLWDLAVCLREAPFGIALAMAMDGGASSDLLVQDRALQRTGSGERAEWQPIVDGSGQSHIPLPAVIGVFPR